MPSLPAHSDVVGPVDEEQAHMSAHHDVMDVKNDARGSRPARRSAYKENQYMGPRTDASEVSSCAGSNDGSVENQSVKIATKESTAVFRLRILVVCTILLAAIGVSVAVYQMTTRHQNEQFMEQFDGAASKTTDAWSTVVDTRFSVVYSLALQCSLYVVGRSNATTAWPNVVIDDFQLRSQVARELSKSLLTRIFLKVNDADRQDFESFALPAMQKYSQEAINYQKEQGLFLEGLDDHRNLQDESGDGSEVAQNRTFFSENGFQSQIYMTDENWQKRPSEGPGPYFPSWQASPMLGTGSDSGWDARQFPEIVFIEKLIETGEMVLADATVYEPGDYINDVGAGAFRSRMISFANGGKLTPYKGDPMSTLLVPIMDDPHSVDSKPVGFLWTVVLWASYFENLHAENFPGLLLVMEQSCGEMFTYELRGSEVIYLGVGDLHDEKYDHCEITAQLHESDHERSSSLDLEINQDVCKYSIRVYPSQALEDHHLTTLPIVVTLVVVLVFVFTGVLFLYFNWYVERRQTVVLDQATRSNAIVSSLFPEAIRDQLMEDEAMKSGKSRIQGYLSGDDNYKNSQRPIADLFPDCTVMFADIESFTAWSSTRDPAQVFVLLQAVYQAFDILARRFSVFKVETIGDSYVAVCGLPKPNVKHAVVMARFSRECLYKFKSIVAELESTLGPDTGALGMRIGLHSGPCTAGVLRGERSRFQLFGDTVNTAARMESTSIRDRIQISNSTKQYLEAGNKPNWMAQRTDTLSVKGKGILSTYWLHVESPESAASTGVADIDEGLNVSMESDAVALEIERSLDWMTDLFWKHVTQIVARQNPNNVKCSPKDLVYVTPTGRTSFDEISEVIKLPGFDPEAAERALARGSIDIAANIKDQLRDVIRRIGDKYHNNAFHNWQHACHVTLAVDKFMSRIATPDLEEYSKIGKGLASQVHEFSHGITSDPITLLAIVFSALVHDTDHRGVSNTQLALEDQQMAEVYMNKSIAEQNSLDMAWSIFMEDKYQGLRSTLFVDRSEMLRFRQVVVQVVLATDIFDKEVNGLRKARWNKAFSTEQAQDPFSANELRATIVIEHIIQASDVSHTMQHWHVYRKWNRNLFLEMTQAHKNGRMTVDPATFWYKGELGFFDNYVIPLAKKLKDCNVFGVSSDECLTYALSNRAEWEERGETVVAELVDESRVDDSIGTLPTEFKV